VNRIAASLAPLAATAPVLSQPLPSSFLRLCWISSAGLSVGLAGLYAHRREDCRYRWPDKSRGRPANVYGSVDADDDIDRLSKPKER
jgi:hypothetical protein